MYPLWKYPDIITLINKVIHINAKNEIIIPVIIPTMFPVANAEINVDQNPFIYSIIDNTTGANGEERVIEEKILTICSTPEKASFKKISFIKNENTL